MHRSFTRALTLAKAIAAVALIGLAPPACAQPNVLTAHYGNTRQGYNGQESVLISGTVASTIKTANPFLVDLAQPGSNLNAVFAQPLWVRVSASLNNCSSPCDLLLVATIGGGLYAFNADDNVTNPLIWSRNQASGTANQTNYFYIDDCGPGSTPSTSGLGTAGLPFAGIVATPVIDNTGSAPVAYLTSLCQSAGGRGNQTWFVHKIDLTTGYDLVTSQTQRKIGGTVPGSLGADNVTTTTPPCPTGTSCIPFTGWEELQRTALLEVSVSGAPTSPLIYFGFGFGTVSENHDPYHGWIMAYDSNLNQKFIFSTSTKGTSDSSGSNTDKTSCSPTCSCGPTSCSPSTGSGGTTCIVTGYHTAANWCGHAAGVWMSGEGGAAVTLSGVSHALFGAGNGAFQQYESDGATLLNPIQNWAQSVMDFTVSSSGYDAAPTQYFTPKGGVPVQEPIGSTNNTFGGMNENDFDMAVSGILVLQDPLGIWRAVTVDKAGYGYLLTVGNLCGDPSSECYPAIAQSLGGKAGAQTGDPGDVFPFVANLAPCSNQESDDSCHRITNLAFYQQGSPHKLYVWPNGERMAALQISDGTTAVTPPAGTPDITWTTGSTTVTFNGTCTQFTNCFTSLVVPGDTLIACGCSGSSCPIITGVNPSGTSLTINNAFPSTCTVPATFQYSGYFVSPIRDAYPVGTAVQNPGGALTVTSNNGSGGLVWALATITEGSGNEGTLLAYDAERVSLQWCSNTDSLCDSSSSFSLTKGAVSIFAEPTVANGYVYIPTFGINMTGGPSADCTGTQCSGVLVYSGH